MTVQRFLRRLVVLTSVWELGAGLVWTAAAQTPLTLSDKIVWGGFVEPARMVRAKGWQWDHEVRVWLPPSYRSSTRTYPTLWVTDNSLEVAQAALTGAGFAGAPELIVVAVGAPRGTGILEFQRRRTYDFIPVKSSMGASFAAVPDSMVGGAPGFLDFLVNQLRPMLAKEYRMDPNDHGYAGHSGGGGRTCIAGRRRVDQDLGRPAWRSEEAQGLGNHADHRRRRRQMAAALLLVASGLANRRQERV